MDRILWLKERKKSLGASDSAAALGISRYRSPLEVWFDKTTDNINEEENEYMYWGHKLEPIIADEFERKTGKRFEFLEINKSFLHPEYPFISATPDRILKDENAVLEIKNVGLMKRSEWDEKIPTEYMIQVQHQMGVLNKDLAYIAALIGGNEFVYQKIERDNDLIKMIFEKLNIFWHEHVLKKIPPVIDGSKSATQMINELFKIAENTSIQLPAEIDKMIFELEEIKKTKKQHEAIIDEYENKIKFLLGNNESGYTERNLITWKNVNVERFDTKTFKEKNPADYSQYLMNSSYRRLNIKERKHGTD